MKIKSLLENSKALGLASYEKIGESTKKVGETVKKYLNDEENIRHISLFVYDVMPLTFKLGFRHEKFYEKFRVVFIGVRNQIFNYDELIINEQVNGKLPTNKLNKQIIKKSQKALTASASPKVKNSPITKKSTSVKNVVRKPRVQKKEIK